MMNLFGFISWLGKRHLILMAILVYTAFLILPRWISLAYQNLATLELVCASSHQIQCQDTRQTVQRYLQQSVFWSQKNGRANYWLGTTLLELGEYKTAIELLQQTSQLYQDTSVHYSLVRAFERTEQWDSAYQEYLFIALGDEKKPNWERGIGWRLFLRKAEEARKLGKWSDAVSNYQQAIIWYPSSYNQPDGIYHQLNLALVEVLKEKLKNYPDNLKLRYEIGWLLQRSGHVEEAQRIFASILQVDFFAESLTVTQLGRIFYLQGLYQEQQDQPDVAIEYYLQALEYEPHLVGVYHHLRSLYLDRGDQEQANLVDNRLNNLLPQHLVEQPVFDNWELTGFDQLDKMALDKGIPMELNLYWMHILPSGEKQIYIETRQVYNLVPNAGFEWEIDSGTGLPFGFQNGTQLGGDDRYYQLFIDEGTKETVVSLDNKLRSTTDIFSLPVAIQQGHSYLLSGNLRVDEQRLGAAYLGVYWLGTQNKQPTRENWIIPGARSKTWVNVAGILQPPKDATGTQVWMMNHSQPLGQVWFDNLLLVEITPPDEFNRLN